MLNLIKYEKEGNDEAIQALLRDRGVWGASLVVVIQALQMIVVFISAEFLQIAAGISFPWYMAILLLDLGVAFGATAIFILVKTFKFDSSMFGKSSKNIERIIKKDRKKNRSTQTLMFILFFMPIIPFGAICYYGASTNISYRRYMITCTLGVIPSILSSLFVGQLIGYFLSTGISIWYLVGGAVIFIGTLFFVAIKIINKLYFKANEGNPNSIYYRILLTIFQFIVKRKSKPTFDRKNFDEVEGPFILLSNHGSFFDVYYLSKLVSPRRMSFILNKYYFQFKYFKKMFSKIGAIPKKLFYPDIETIRGTIKSIKDEFPVLMCPEGRLSIDGTNYYVNEETAKLLKKLKVPVVIVNIHGAYITNPKWREKRIKGRVHTEVSHIISKEDVENLSLEEITSIINEKLYYNDFEYAREHGFEYRSKNMLKGAETVLYRCPKCHKEYVLESNGNKLVCKECGFEVETNQNYSFKENELGITDFAHYYSLIKDYERQLIQQNGIDLTTEVTIQKFDFNNKKYKIPGEGVCHLTTKEFNFKGIVDGKEIEFTIPISNLHALAFSCNEEFECYYAEDLYYFYPKVNRLQCVKWALLVDLLNEGVDKLDE